MSTKPVRLQIKRDTTKNWDTASQKGFKPLGGEFIEYTDAAPHRLKLGDGTRTPNQLPWYEGQADWNQSDPTHREYIQNRTHYDDSTYQYDKIAFDLSNTDYPSPDWSGQILSYPGGVMELSTCIKDGYFQPGKYTVKCGFTGLSATIEPIILTTVTTFLEFPCLFQGQLIGDDDYSYQGSITIGIDTEESDYLTLQFEDGTDFENFGYNLCLEYECQIPNLKQLDPKYIPVDDETIITDDNGKLKVNQHQADWNQPSELAPDYIKNRTHGINYIVKAEATAQDGSYEEDYYAGVPLGSDFMTTAWEMFLPGTYIDSMGNIEVVEPGEENTEETGVSSLFNGLVFRDGGDNVSVDTKRAKFPYTLKLYQEDGVKQLDTKYIPVAEYAFDKDADGKLVPPAGGYGYKVDFNVDHFYSTEDNLPIDRDHDGEYIFIPGIYTCGSDTAVLNKTSYEVNFEPKDGSEAYQIMLRYSMEDAVDGFRIETSANAPGISSIEYTSLGGFKQFDSQYIPIDNKTIAIDDNGKLKAKQLQADWNQNDKTKADFVKNKTHYEENISQSSYFVFGKTEIPLDRIPIDAQNITFKFDLSYDDPAGYVDTEHVEKTYSSLLSDELTDPIFDFSVKPYEGDNSIPTDYGEVYFGFNYLTNKPTLYLDIDEMPLDNGLRIDVTVTANVTRQLDKKYIPLELERGAAKKSLQTPGATALTEDSFAAGTSLAGCRGYYIGAIDFANKYLYLQKNQVGTEPLLVPRYIFATHFKNYEYVIKADGQVLTPIEIEAITVGSLSFDVYKTAARNISVTYPNIESTAQKNRTYQFLDWEVQRWQRNEGQTVDIDCCSSIILQYGSNYLSDLSEFIMYCQDYADEAMYYDPDFKTGYDRNAVRGKHFYTINNFHYLTDDDVKGDRDATIVGIEGNRVIWTGDIGYDSIIPDPSLAFYDYSFMIPEIPNPSDDAINLKPFAISIGTGNKNIGRLSFSIGSGCQALQDFAFVGGNGCKANYMDFSFGNSNIANGQYGAALGGKRNTIERGSPSAVIIGGDSNRIESNAIRSFIGAGTLNVIRNGAEDAFVSGRRLTANAIGQTVLGRDNEPDASKLFILGGGYEDSQINVFTIDDSGNVIATGKFTAGADPFYNMDLTTKQYVDKGLATKITKNTSEESKQTVYITDPQGNQSYKRYTSEAYPSTIVHRENSLNTFAVGDPVFSAHPVTMRFANERYFPLQKTSELTPYKILYFSELDEEISSMDDGWYSFENVSIVLDKWVTENLQQGQKLFTNGNNASNLNMSTIVNVVPDPNEPEIAKAKNIICTNFSTYDKNGNPITYKRSPYLTLSLVEEEGQSIYHYDTEDRKLYRDVSGWHYESNVGIEDFSHLAIVFYDVADYTEHVTSSVMIQDPQGNPSYKPYTQFAEYGTIPMRSTAGSPTFDVGDPVNDANPVTLSYAQNHYEVKKGSSAGPDSVAIMEAADKSKTYSWGDKYVRYYKGNGRFNVADPTGSLHPVNLRYFNKTIADLEERMAELEERIAALEGGGGSDGYTLTFSDDSEKIDVGNPGYLVYVNGEDIDSAYNGEGINTFSNIKSFKITAYGGFVLRATPTKGSAYTEEDLFTVTTISGDDWYSRAELIEEQGYFIGEYEFTLHQDCTITYLREYDGENWG